MPRTFVGGAAASAPDPLPSASLARAVLYLVPDARFSYDPDVGYASIEWDGPGAQPTEAQVEAARTAATARLRAPYTNEATLRQQVESALVDLRTYRDIQGPTNAQTVAAVKLLCRVAIALIRMRINKLDGVD
jgi:hypothetical protein